MKRTAGANRQSTALAARYLPHRSDQRPGFILVLVLAMLVVMALLTVGVSRQSLQQAQQAATATERLQDRWARVSLQQAVTQLGRQWMMTRTTADGAPQRALPPRAFLLNSNAYYWAIADENAKANLNTIFHHQGANDVEAAIRRLAPSSSSLGLRLQPYAPAQMERDDPAYDSWGQIFERLDTSAGNSNGMPTVFTMTQDLTCWGGGRLRLSRATDEIIRVVLAQIVRASVVQRLLEERRASPERSLSELWPVLDLQEKERKNLEMLLTDRSDCMSVWMWEDRAGVPHGVELHISEWTTNHRSITSTFCW